LTQVIAGEAGVLRQYGSTTYEGGDDSVAEPAVVSVKGHQLHHREIGSRGLNVCLVDAGVPSEGAQANTHESLTSRRALLSARNKWNSQSMTMLRSY
jgi:hypothetical protein